MSSHGSPKQAANVRTGRLAQAKVSKAGVNPAKSVGEIWRKPQRSAFCKKDTLHKAVCVEHISYIVYGVVGGGRTALADCAPDNKPIL